VGFSLFRQLVVPSTALFWLGACGEHVAPVAKPPQVTAVPASSFARRAPPRTRLLVSARLGRSAAAVDLKQLAAQLPGCDLRSTNLERLEIAVAEPLEVRLDLTGDVSLEVARCLLDMLGRIDPSSAAKLHAVKLDHGVRVATEGAMADGPGAEPALAQRFEELSARSDYVLVSNVAPGGRLYELSASEAAASADAQLALATPAKAEQAAAWLSAAARGSPDPALRSLTPGARGASLTLHVANADSKLAATIKRELLEVFRTPSDSMQPTLVPGDHLLVLRNLHDRAVERGDIVAFASPRDPSQVFLKRVIGVAGDRIELEGYRVRLNGVALETALDTPRYEVEGSNAVGGELWRETLGAHHYRTLRDMSRPSTERADITVEPDSVFVMGDNRDNSFDSRHFGSIKQHLLRGRGVLIWASFLPSGVNWERFGLELE
jgi:signal peptidase I